MIFLLVLLCSSTFSIADEPVKKYPPYPDVWGIELPVSKTVTYAGIDVIKMPDGDFMIGYLYDYKYLKSEKAKDFDPSKHRILKPTGFLFFALKEVKFDPKDNYYDFLKKARDEGRELKSYPIVFSDGSSMKQMPEGGGSPKGSNPIDWYLERKDKNGKVLLQKKLLYIYDKPLRAKMLMSERNFNYKGDYYLERVNWPMQMKYIPLEDDTFLLVGFIEHQKPKSIVIIRFDKDFKTNSDLMGKKLFLMDESIYKKMQSPPIDDNKAQKLLYEHLTKQKKGGSHGNHQ
jgi:hypothetical protein